MNARERLRLYLEQRRELGDTELVLDALPVDEVMRLLGAPASTRTTSRATTSAPVESSPPPTVQIERPLNQYVPPQREAARAAPTPPAPSPSAPVPTTASPLPAWLAALELPAGINIGGSQSDLAPTRASALDSIDAIAASIAGCRECPLGASAKNPVPGEGNANADFVCVGEAPGAVEDEMGRPFVGPAGQLLTKILQAIQLDRSDVFICNVLKHRPPGNRNPMPDEVRACAPYLMRQLELLQPKVILALGVFAAQTLLDTTQSIGKLRGQIHRFHGIPLIVTYHPSALLRNEAWKRPTWDDVRIARRILDAARTLSAGEHS